MFELFDDMSIYVTRGDGLYFDFYADNGGKNYKFKPGDVLQISVAVKKDMSTVVLQKRFPVEDYTEKVRIYLTKRDTRIGGVISKPTDYWYQIRLNPDDETPQSIVAYDEDGPKLFRLFPEAEEIDEPDPAPEEIPIVDQKLDMTSTRPVGNQAISRAYQELLAGYERTHAAVAEINVTPQMFGAIGDGVADDTEAFQSAVDCLGDTASKLLVPYGKYRLSDAILLENKSNIQIIGMGRPTIIFDSQESTHSGFYFTNYKDIEVSGFSFVSTRDKTEYPPVGHGTVGYASSNILAIHLVGGENATFKDNHFSGMMADYWIVGSTNKNILVDGWISQDASMPTYCSHLHGAEFRHSKIIPATELGAGNHIFYISTKSKGVRIIDCECETKDNTMGVLISHYNAHDENDKSIQPIDLLVKDFKGKGARLYVGNKYAEVRFENVDFEQIYETYLSNTDESGATYSTVECVTSAIASIEMIGCHIVTLNAAVVFEGATSVKLLLESSIFELGSGGMVLYNSKVVVKNCDFVCGTFIYSNGTGADCDVYIANCRIKASSYILSRRNTNNGVFTFANNVITGNNSRFFYSAGTSDCTGVTILNSCMFNMSDTFKLGSTDEIANIVSLNNYVNGAVV